MPEFDPPVDTKPKLIRSREPETSRPWRLADAIVEVCQGRGRLTQRLVRAPAFLVGLLHDMVALRSAITGARIMAE